MTYTKYKWHLVLSQVFLKGSHNFYHGHHYHLYHHRHLYRHCYCSFFLLTVLIESKCRWDKLKGLFVNQYGAATTPSPSPSPVHLTFQRLVCCNSYHPPSPPPTHLPQGKNCILLFQCTTHAQFFIEWFSLWSMNVVECSKVMN